LGRERYLLFLILYINALLDVLIKLDDTNNMPLFQAKQLAQLLDEDPALMERRQQCAKRLELYKSARDEIDSVSWAR